jgi:hypothetical protein
MLEERLGDEMPALLTSVSTRPERCFAAATTLCAVARSRMSPAIASPCSSLDEAIDREVATTRNPSLR